MIVIDDATAVVFNTNGLRDAVSTNSGIDTVYFGADITQGEHPFLRRN